MAAVHRQLECAGARSVLDLGCGDGPLFLRLAGDERFRELLALDLSSRALETLRQRLAAANLLQPDRTRLVQASFTDPAALPNGFDAAILVEAIEHVSLAELPLVERAVFGACRPATVVVTTPNVEFNDLLGVPRRRFRHPGHRFEWNRRQFRKWSDDVGRRCGYAPRFHDVGGSHLHLGGPTQMAVFTRL